MQLRFNDLAGLDAAGADAHALVAAAYFGVDRAEVDVPAPLGHVVRVGDVVAELWAFAADFADLCHGETPEFLIAMNLSVSRGWATGDLLVWSRKMPETKTTTAKY
jgi:hypothetical protein